MSGKVTGAARADAIAAMHSILPAAQQKGLEAVIAAHGQCQ
jgi:hypothetical protein